MIVVISVAVGMILWIIIYSLGAKGFDGLMVFLLVVLAAATIRGLSVYLPGNRDSAEAAPDAAPYN